MQNIITDQDQEAFRKWLSEILLTGEITVIFEKKDGTKRQMRCTTCSDLIPPRPLSVDSTPRERRQNLDVQPVYDLDISEWRSFRWDSVREVHIGVK